MIIKIEAKKYQEETIRKITRPLEKAIENNDKLSASILLKRLELMGLVVEITE